MKKVLWNIIIIIYVLIAVTVTICLLAYNEYKVTEIANNTLIIINDNVLEDYSKGTLVIAKRENLDNIQVGEKVFFYKDNEINYGEVLRVNSYEGVSPTYILDGDYQLIVNDIAGTSTSAIAVPKLGTILRILESKVGFLIIIVLPSLIAFFHEIFELILELREKD